MKSFGSDNHSGVHPTIWNSLNKSSQEHAPSYGTDEWTAQLQTLLKKEFGKSCEPFLVFNGTAANVLCLDSLVQSHEAVLTADVSHLQMDECGAPEKNIGCKLISVPTKDGKLSPEVLKNYIIRKGDQHFSQVRAVSITQPTEYGTLYSLEELKNLRKFTKDHGLFLHIDGARFIYAPTLLNCSFYDLAEGLGVDAISFGGTKNGLLFGEICLIFNNSGKERFKYRRKQMMQLPSKQRFIAAQFLTLFENQLWKEISNHCHNLALYLRQELELKFPKFEITQKTQANSVFVKLPKKHISTLRKNFFFYVWDELTFECRLMMSFDLTRSDIDAFIKNLSELTG